MVNGYSSYPPKIEMVQYLTDLNIGYDFKLNKPYDWFKLANGKKKLLEKYWLAAILSKQVGDISKATKLPHADLWIYSFPCTDISVAGNQKGLTKGGNTRSGLLWEIERLLNISQSYSELPTYLLMENVANLVGKEFSKDFYKWLNFLEDLGYENHWSILNAKDYGIPQNRERVFVISILKAKEQEYEFPLPFKLELRLKDLLETEVDERFYLSDEVTKGLKPNKDICNTIRAGGRSSFDNKHTWDLVAEETARCIQAGVLSGGKFDNYLDVNKRYYDTSGISPTVITCAGGGREPKILEPLIAASRGRNPDNPSDRTIGSPTEQRLEINEQGISNTLTSVQKDNYVIELKLVGGVGEINFGSQYRQGNRIYDSEEIAMCLLSQPVGNAGGNSYLYQVGKPTYRIRKLTPLECWRLMDFDDEDVFKARAVGMSDSQLYKQAGNSIVVACLYYIFRKLLVDTKITQPKQLSLF